MPFFLPTLKTLGHLNQTAMTLAIVGSRKLSDEDEFGYGAWNLFAPNLSIYGFDADADACDQANARLEAEAINWTEKHLPFVLGSAVGEATLYVTKDPMCSSLYRPNQPFFSRFNKLVDLMTEEFSVELETTTLDQVCEMEEIQAIDFLKVDVQGGDFQVLQGATQILDRSILAVQVEVEFSPLYHNQPLFADVDMYLRQKGFTLFDISVGYGTRARSPIKSAICPGQLLWGDAFYLRDLLQPDTTSPLKTPAHLFKLACIADILEFPDYALEILEVLTLQYGRDSTYNFADAILQSFAQLPELVQQGEAIPVIASLRPYISESVWNHLVGS
jgi:FkbM family methyltransferase